MEPKFLICAHCGNIVSVVKDAGVPIKCCGENMKELVPGTTEGAAEKHLPVCQVEGNRVRVKVGSTAHPMEEEHSIQWVALQTKQGAQYKTLAPGRSPEVCFALCDADEVEAALAYCDLHGLWKA